MATSTVQRTVGSTVSALDDWLTELDAETAGAAVGALSLGLGALAVAAPAQMAGVFGLRTTAGPVPLLVRMIGVRNATAGVRTLQASGDDLPRALQAGLVLGAVDAAAVVLAVRKGAMSKPAGAAALAVLAGIALLGVAAGRD